MLCVNGPASLVVEDVTRYRFPQARRVVECPSVLVVVYVKCAYKSFK
jgi:hypothetical protein